MIPGPSRVPDHPWLLPSIILIAGLLPPGVHPLAMAPLALAILLLALDLARRRAVASAPAGVAVPLAVAAGMAGLSAFLAFQPMRSVRVLVSWLLGAVVFLAARAAAGPTSRRRIVAAVVLVAAMQGALGVYQSAIGFPAAAGELAPALSDVSGSDAVRLTAMEARLRSGRAVGLLGLPALLASLILLALPAAAAAALTRSGSARIAWGGGALLMAAGLVATRSVGGAGALLAAAALCSVLWRPPRRGLRIALIAVLLLLAAGASLPRLLQEGAGSAPRALLFRASNWRSALDMALTHPAAGTGPGNFGVDLPLHRFHGGNETQHAHNSWLEALSDCGIPILPFLFLLTAGFARMIARRSRRAAPDAAERWMDRALAVGALAWALQNLVDFSAYVAGSLILFMAIAGLASGSGEGRRIRPAGRLQTTLTTAAVILAVLFSVPDAVSRWHLVRAADEARGGRIDAALASARSSVRWNPWEPEARNALALALLDRAAAEPEADRGPLLAESLAEAGDAVRLDPHTGNRRRTLSRARLASGDVAGAYAEMAMAARLNPSRSEYAEERDRLRRALEGGGEPAR